MIKSVKFLSIPVADQDRALAFYTEQLGFAIATDQEMGGPQRWIELRIPGAETRVALFTPEGHQDRVGSFTGVSFEVDDVTTTHRELTGRGVHFDKPPQKQPWGEFAIFRDSEGNQFVIGSK
ncbi:MAG: VOC family protein [Thermoanaerobaculia bacterium]